MFLYNFAKLNKTTISRRFKFVSTITGMYAIIKVIFILNVSYGYYPNINYAKILRSVNISPIPWVSCSAKYAKIPLIIQVCGLDNESSD